MSNYLIVGLGNPGSEYAKTRHNIAWMLLENLSFSNELRWKEKFKGVYAQFRDNLYLMPQTYMNLSGESVQPCSKFFKIDVENIVVIHDELDLPFGTIMFKKDGGLAGHNGLKSIAEKMGTRNFIRMRLGIGRPKYGDVSNYVLSRFSEEELIRFEDYMKLSSEALEYFLEKGLESSMRKYKKAKINN